MSGGYRRLGRRRTGEHRCGGPCIRRTGCHAHGGGRRQRQYRTVQAAINAAPANSSARTTIMIKAGTYREVVRVPSNKAAITLQGLGSTPAQTVLVFNNSGTFNSGTFNSASMFVDGRDFGATNLTISNDYAEKPGNEGNQAVALHLNADRAVFRNVRLLGDQDTFPVNEKTRAYMADSHNSWKKARFLEYRNTGPGATKNSNRPQLQDSLAGDYTPQKYLAGTDGWNPR
jgi:pectin methylesterase-like acyl-CoA thioesterase